jgi:outer membrane protein insertion porin family
VSSTNLYHETLEELNKDFGLRASGATLGLYRQIGNRLNAGLNFQFEYREQYRTDNQPASKQGTDAYKLRSIMVSTPSVVYNSIDSFIRPTQGMRAAFSMDISRGLKNSLDNFLKYQFDGCYYSTPVKHLTLAFRSRIGYIDTLDGNSRIPEDQLFFLGGLQNIRGFAENKLRFDTDNNPVGGRTAILGSMEARFDIGMNFELATFYDTGSVRAALSAAGNDEFRSSVGLALRYMTPVGPIGCMYGWKLDRKPGESSGAFHFAIGYTF